VLLHVPRLVDLTLFGWEHLRVEVDSWCRLSTHLVNLDLVGLGFNAAGEIAAGALNAGGYSPSFDISLLAEAGRLRRLRVAGWGDTVLTVDQLLATLPALESLYLEDVKIVLSSNSSWGSRNDSWGRNSGGSRKSVRRNHQLSSLNICHCSTTQVGTGQPTTVQYVKMILEENLGCRLLRKTRGIIKTSAKQQGYLLVFWSLARLSPEPFSAWLLF
jgi:hypothetical protein